MSDLIIRWWPKSGCTKSIATMDEDFARLTRELATVTEQRDIAEASLERLQQRWDERPLSAGDESERLRGLLRDEGRTAETIAGEYETSMTLLAEAEWLLRQATDDDGVDAGFDERLEAFWKAREAFKPATTADQPDGHRPDCIERGVSGPCIAGCTADNSPACPRPDCVDGHIPSLPNGEPIPCPDCNRD